MGYSGEEEMGVCVSEVGSSECVCVCVGGGGVGIGDFALKKTAYVKKV